MEDFYEWYEGASIRKIIVVCESRFIFDHSIRILTTANTVGLLDLVERIEAHNIRNLANDIRGKSKIFD